MQKKILRHVQTEMETWLFKGKVLLLYGARQVGKTTLSKEILAQYGDDGAYFNCEIQSVLSSLGTSEPTALKRFIGHKKIVVFDEAQYVPNIGRVLKLLHDTFPEVQLIATGSSSFELANRSSEPMTGRAITFELLPFSWAEIGQAMHPSERAAHLDFFLRFGLYPDIAFAPESEARTLLDNLSSRYLFKDVLEFEQLKHPRLLTDLLQMLALQVGSLVSYNELAQTLKISSVTVERYIDLLEKAFVIFRLRPFSRNLRNEIGKKNKIFFFDVGIRNSLVRQYQPMDLRGDKGGLWENFLVVERLKWLQSKQMRPNRHFWRTLEQAEIDYLEDIDGQLSAFEFKWADRLAKVPIAFARGYPGSTFEVIHRQNFEGFIE